MSEFKKILVTTDFSDTSTKAIEPALALARRFDSKVVLVYVEDDRFPPLVVEYMAVGLDDIRRQQHDESSKRLEKFAEPYRKNGVAIEVVVPNGVPHAEIVRLAEEREVDLIVMATHGRGFISHAIMGSTTERVLRRAPCPVLAVRDPGPS